MSAACRGRRGVEIDVTGLGFYFFFFFKLVKGVITKKKKKNSLKVSVVTAKCVKISRI